MQKYKKIFLLLIIPFLLIGCGKKEYKENDEITLKGKISTATITKDDETRTVNILNLDDPIIIDGTRVNKIEIAYDKDLKDGYEVTIKGTIKNNGDSGYQLSYAFDVIDIDDVLSFVNTFSNEDFSFAIPSELIKKVNIKEVERGFAIYSIDNPDNELFRIVAVTKPEFNKLHSIGNIEKIDSNLTKVVIIEFNDKDNNQDNYEIANEIFSNIVRIKKTVQLK